MCAFILKCGDGVGGGLFDEMIVGVIFVGALNAKRIDALLQLAIVGIDISLDSSVRMGNLRGFSKGVDLKMGLVSFAVDFENFITASSKKMKQGKLPTMLMIRATI